MAEKESTVGRWYKEFFENIHIFIRSGMSEKDAKGLLEKFLHLSSTTPMPPVMDIFKEPEKMEELGVYTEGTEQARNFMMQFLSPIMKNFRVDGVENLKVLNSLMGKYPITLISNHLSHLDAPAIFQLLYSSGEEGKKLAQNMVFIAGRLAFEPDFTRLGLYMFGTLLVCSKKDMADNPSLSDLMTKINMRSFRQSQKLQTDGKVISIFPEGTRSRDGRLMPFVDTVYHYVANKVVLPISLEGTEKILPTTSFLFSAAQGRLVIGKPVLVGELSKKLMADFPKDVEQLPFPEVGDKKQFLIDNLALLVGSNLSKHKHGTYRNLYNGDVFAPTQNVLIQPSKSPDEKIGVIGSSNMSVAIAAVLSNKNVNIKIYNPDKESVEQCNLEKRDMEHYPLFKLPPNIQFTSDPAALEDSTIFIQGTNPWELDNVYPSLKSILAKNKSPIVNVIKGFTGSSNGLILDDLNTFYGIEKERLAVVSGACYPDQIMERKITGFEVAAVNAEIIPRIKKLFSTGYVFSRRAIIETDVKGVQLGGALKTIYALTMGVVEGFFKQNLGGNVDNTLFHLSDRFFKEMVAIGVELGGKQETFQGLSGLTDFMLACFGSDTHDRKHGYDLVIGNALDKISNGFYGLRVIPNLIKVDPEKLPIVSATYDVVIQKKNLDQVILNLQEKLTRI